jgi:hypothetical protein
VRELGPNARLVEARPRKRRFGFERAAAENVIIVWQHCNGHIWCLKLCFICAQSGTEDGNGRRIE